MGATCRVPINLISGAHRRKDAACCVSTIANIVLNFSSDRLFGHNDLVLHLNRRAMHAHPRPSKLLPATLILGPQ